MIELLHFYPYFFGIVFLGGTLYIAVYSLLPDHRKRDKEFDTHE
jgi:hypothetical protein